MGVMTCHRGDCTNIMCDRISHEYGYICHECFDELVKLGYKADVKEFMDSDTSDRSIDFEDMAYMVFDKMFPAD